MAWTCALRASHDKGRWTSSWSVYSRVPWCGTQCTPLSHRLWMLRTANSRRVFHVIGQGVFWNLAVCDGCDDPGEGMAVGSHRQSPTSNQTTLDALHAHGRPLHACCVVRVCMLQWQRWFSGTEGVLSVWKVGRRQVGCAHEVSSMAAEGR